MSANFNSQQELPPKFVVRRYEVILSILIFILTGSVGIISKGSEHLSLLERRYPYSIALTFDDGPYPLYTEKLIKLLENENVKSTFFVIGKHVEKHPELVRLIASKGHELGGHTYTHRNITHISNEELKAELEKTRKAIENATGITTYLFRPPGGRYNKDTIKFVTQLGYTTVLWSILPKDHEANTTKENIITRTVQNATPNGIILLHSGRQRTLDALPEIIWQLRLKGYKFVTISELKETNPKIVMK